MSSITFYCLCGKKLKARASSAGKRTQCPQCGDPVGIPTSSGPAAPPASRKESVEAVLRTPQESGQKSGGDPVSPAIHDDRVAGDRPGVADATLTESSGDSSVSAEARSVSRKGTRGNRVTSDLPAGPRPYFMDDGPAPPPRTIRKKKRGRGNRSSSTTRGLPSGDAPGDAARAASRSLADSPEEGLQLRNQPRWYRLISRNGEYRGPSAIYEVGYALGNAPLVITLSALLALTSGTAAIQLPRAMQNSRDALAMFILVTIAFFIVAAHLCAYFHQTILNAALNQGKDIDLDPVRTVKTGFAWVAAGLAGPVLPAAGLFFYWLRIGLEEPVDWIIAGELIWLTFFWLTACLLSYGIDAELKSLQPHRAFRKAGHVLQAIAFRSALAAAICAATVAAVWQALIEIHEAPVLGFAILGLAFLPAIGLGAGLAGSIGRVASGLIPRQTERPDSLTEDFEQELASRK